MKIEDIITEFSREMTLREWFVQEESKALEGLQNSSRPSQRSIPRIVETSRMAQEILDLRTRLYGEDGTDKLKGKA